MAMIGLAQLSLVGALTMGPPPPQLESGPPPAATPAPVLVTRPEPGLRARRFFIAGGVLLGLGMVGEIAGAAVAMTCRPPSNCNLGFTYNWGPSDDGSRYALTTAGPGSAYVLARAVSIPVVWIGKGLLLAGSQQQAIADASAGVGPASKRIGWSLLGPGLAIYFASRLARFGFAAAGVCQDPRCFYGFDQVTLGLSRGLTSPGSGFLMHHRTHARVRLGVAPMASYGIGLTGAF